MGAPLSTWGILGLAILCEVVGTSFLNLSAQFTRPWPTAAMGLCYLA